MSSSLERLVLASHNRGKFNELCQLLAPLGVEVVAQSVFDVAEVAETGTTFVENAIIKARHCAKCTGLPALADDSGLVVDALQGAPGVRSARFAGDTATDGENVERLLQALKDVDAQHRQAHFVCVLALMRSSADPTPIVCEGFWHGHIADVASGVNGFGYDPVFYVPSLKCTSAQLTPEQKNQFSHRAQALRALLSRLSAV